MYSQGIHTDKTASECTRMIGSKKEADFYKAVGKELRAFREQADIPQEAVGDLVGHQRAAISKIEGGDRRLCLYDYLLIMDFLRDAVPEDHPALELIERFMGRPRRLRRG